MKKLILLGLMGLGFASSHSANAGVGRELGDTTCYVFKQNKLNTKSPCKQYNVMGANAVYPSYSFENYSVKIPKVGVIDVVNSTPCERENKCQTTYTVNGKPAVGQFRLLNQQYKVISAKQGQNLDYSSNLLKCDRTTDNKLEICTPSKPAKEFIPVNDPPSWVKE